MAFEILSNALTIGIAIKSWFDSNAEAKRRATQLAPSLDIIRNNLIQLKSASDDGKLSSLTSEQKSSLDAAVAQTFEVLRDCHEIMKQFDNKKKSKLKGWLVSPKDVIEDIAKRRGDIIVCVQLIGLCMQTTAFLQSVAQTPKASSTTAGVTNIVPEVKSTVDVVQNQMKDAEARAFWMSNFGGSLAVPFATWYSKLNTAFGPFDDATCDVIKLNVDDENRGTVLFLKFKNWIGNSTLRAALDVVKVDQTPTPSVVVVQPAPTPIEVKSDGETPATPHAPETPSNAAAEPSTPIAAELKGTADPKAPPADLQLIWADPNHSEWNLDTIAELTAAGVKLLCFERQSEVIAFFNAYPAFLRSPKLRVMSNNRMPGGDDFKTQSAATEVVNYMRKKRSMIPVLIYCGGTIENAREIAKKARKVSATDDMDVAMSFAKGEAITWG